ncbi:MAG: polysaccharide deacetylase family protein [Bacteroidota bacterium]
MNLTIGILHYEAGWEILFRQIGVNWRSISASDELSPDNFSAIVVNVPPTSLQEHSLEKYLDEGGAILALGRGAEPFISSRLKKKYFTSILPSLLGNFIPSEMLDIYASGIMDINSFNQSHQLSTVHRIGQGILVVIPFNVNALIIDTRSKRKNFFFEKKRLPGEVVATVSKGNLRRFVTAILQFLHHQREIPFVHKWYYPENRETIFTFRVDSDQGTPTDVDNLHALCDNHSIKTMWFVDTKSHEQWLSRFKYFGHQEIGIHCYDHLTYSSEDKNRQNFLKALSLLKSEGIDPKGVAAPYGTWNASVVSVFEEVGAGFSSEFGLDYDDLPFFPFVETKFSPVLQLPIHPICVGSMRRAGYSNDEMKKYFFQLIDIKLAQREPLCLYHHPTHHHLDLFEDLFKYIRSKKIDNFSYSEYASWWRKRDETVWSFQYHKERNELTTHSTNMNADVHWHIAFPNGEESIMSSEGIVQLKSIPRRRAGDKTLPSPDIARSRDFDFRHIIMNLLDAWYKRTQ